MNILLCLIMVVMAPMIFGCSTGGKRGAVSPRFAGEIPFNFDSDGLALKSREGVASTADFMKSHPRSVMVLEGHTDAIGAREYNEDLGDRRARSVKAYLVGQGVAEERLVTVTFGETRPKTPLVPARENRRVEVMTLGR